MNGREIVKERVKERGRESGFKSNTEQSACVRVRKTLRTLKEKKRKR